MAFPDFMKYNPKVGGVKSVGDNTLFMNQGIGSAGLAGSPTGNVPTGMADWTPAASSAFESMVPMGTGGTAINNLPAAQGGWFDMQGKGGMALGVGQMGLGIYNAFQQGKQNDFMKSYYTNQMDLQKQDFTNAAEDLNKRAAEREGRRIDAAQGLTYDSAANIAGRNAYMKDWGVKTTF